MKKSWMMLSLSLAAPTLVLGAQIKFYGGLAGGVGNYSADYTNTAQTQTFFLGPVSNDIFVTQTDTNQYSGVGQIQLGLGIRTQRFYIGLEALGQLSNAEYDSLNGGFDFIGLAGGTPTTQELYDAQLTMNDFEPAFDLKPGIFLFTSTLLYGRIGAAFNEVTLTNTADYDFINSLATQNAESSTSEDVTALRLGLGVEHPIHNNFTIFADYTYTMYNSITLTRQDEIPGHGSGADFLFIVNSELKADDLNKQVAMLGFNYYF